MATSQVDPKSNRRDWRGLFARAGNQSPNRLSCWYWLNLATFAAILLSLACFLMLYFLVQGLVTPMRSPVTTSPASYGLAYQPVTLTTADGLHLRGWYIPGSRPEAIILVHGIHANRSQMMPQALPLAEAGYHLLLFDLRGHGHSDASDLTYGYREALDVQAAVDYLLATPGVEQVGAFGSSLGGAVVARAAAIEPRLSAVVIENSFSSLPRTIENHFNSTLWLGLLLTTLAEYRIGLKAEQVNPARDLAAFRQPVLIIHGDSQPLYPVEYAYSLYEAAGGPKELWLVKGLGHVSPAVEREAEFKTRLLSFFERAFAQ